MAEANESEPQGTTILLTTHVMDEADKCHQLGMIRDGSLTAMGTPEELKQATSSSTIEEAFLVYGGVAHENSGHCHPHSSPIFP